MEHTHLNKLHKVGIVLLGVLSVYILVLSINALKENTYIGRDISVHTISVSGVGEVFVIPDIAQFHVSVIEKGDTVPEAQKANAQKINDVVAFLGEEGVEEVDIKTTYFNVRPVYEFRREIITCIQAPCPQPQGKQVLAGYEVSQTLSVKVRDTEQAGMLLTRVGTLGATNISNLQFIVDDREAFIREARKLAIYDAQEKAKALARDLGVKFVNIVSFSEGQSYAPRPTFAREASFGADVAAVEVLPEIPLGETRIVSNVTITYEIK